MALGDVFFPRRCVGCGLANPDATTHLCWDCLAACQLVQPPYCARCGDPVAGFIDHEYCCAACGDHPPHFASARSVARYDGVVRQMILAFKYHAATWLAGDLLHLLATGYATYFSPDDVQVIAFVPLHPTRRRERGFNQAELLAHGLSRRFGKPLLRPGLVRRRPTPSQTRLTAAQRRANVQDAFQIRNNPWLEGKRILLIDDVMTTGATVDACARQLTTAGAARVHVLTLARG